MKLDSHQMAYLLIGAAMICLIAGFGNVVFFKGDQAKAEARGIRVLPAIEYDAYPVHVKPTAVGNVLLDPGIKLVIDRCGPDSILGTAFSPIGDSVRSDVVLSYRENRTGDWTEIQYAIVSDGFTTVSHVLEGDSNPPLECKLERR